MEPCYFASIVTLMTGDTANVWQDIELRINPDPFCTSCQISSMNKKDRSKNTLTPKKPFKWGFMVIIPPTSPKHLTNETTFLIIFSLLIHTQKYQKIMVWE